MINHRELEHTLISNGYVLDNAPNRLGWLIPSDPAAPVASLREQYQAQGYLWLKGILNRREVLDFRRRYFAAFRHTGLLAEGSDPVNGVFSGGAVNQQAITRLNNQIVRWAAYEAFCLSRPIWTFYESFLGGPVYLHKRKLIRYTTTAQTDSTGAHYDLTYLRGGTDQVVTSWIPIGDIPVEMGGLVYLEGSDAFGRQREAEFTVLNADLPPDERISAYNRNMKSDWLTKDLPSLANRLDTRWLVADYEAGDMVVHSAYMIHAATSNRSLDNRIRLSTDIRYQRVDLQIDERWSHDWSSDDGL